LLQEFFFLFLEFVDAHIELDFRVVSRLLEKDKSLLRSHSQATDALQLRALRALSPHTDGSGKRNLADGDNSTIHGHDRKEKGNADKRPNKAIQHASQDTEAGDRGPKPRISRPTFIRRPKLIGKSVEGAAMQAVAASRARASNKQRFARGGTASVASTSQKSQRDDDGSVTTRTSTAKNEEKASAERVALMQKRQTLAQADESLTAAKRRFDAQLSRNSNFMRQRSSQHWFAVQNLTSLWWPSNDKGTIPRSVCEFILSRSPRVWSFAREIPNVPVRLLNTFALSLAQAIRMWHPDIALLPVPSREVAKDNAVLLMGEMKGVRSCRCLVIFKISLHRFEGKGRQRHIVRNQAWVATLQRHQKTGRKTVLSMDLGLSERDATALDKLAAELHVCFIVVHTIN
jgi:hypothetical protein